MIPGMNPKKMKQMERQMKKMGMKMDDVEGVEEWVVTLIKLQVMFAKKKKK